MPSGLRDLLLGHKCNGLGGCCKLPNFLAKRVAPNFPVFWMLEEMPIFKEVACFIVKHCICEITKELKGVLAGCGLFVGERLCQAGSIHHVEEVVLCDCPNFMLETSVLRWC